MPTTHRRHAVTETDDIKNALQIAGQAWPDLADKPAALLRGLILTGRNTLARDRVAASSKRLRAVEETSGGLAGVFRPDFLRELREDWPE